MYILSLLLYKIMILHNKIKYIIGNGSKRRHN